LDFSFANTTFSGDAFDLLLDELQLLAPCRNILIKTQIMYYYIEIQYALAYRTFNRKLPREV
jgi:hypothetical protein